jgi:spoIIIJ-associated protein
MTRASARASNRRRERRRSPRTLWFAIPRRTGITLVRIAGASRHLEEAYMAPATLFIGKTLEDAVKKGLESLGLSRAEAMITVIEEGSAGFLGLGARPYRVRIMPRPGGAIREPEEREPRSVRSRGTERGPRAPRGGDREARGGRSGRSERPERGTRTPRAERAPKAERGDRGAERSGERAATPPVSAAPAREPNRGRPEERRLEERRAGDRRQGDGQRRTGERRDTRVPEPRRDEISQPSMAAPMTPPAARAPIAPVDGMAAGVPGGDGDGGRRRRRRGRRGGRGRGGEGRGAEVRGPVAGEDRGAEVGFERPSAAQHPEESHDLHDAPPRYEPAVTRNPEPMYDAPRAYEPAPVSEAPRPFEPTPAHAAPHAYEPAPVHENRHAYEPAARHDAPPFEESEAPIVRSYEAPAERADRTRHEGDATERRGPALSDAELAAEGKRWTEELLTAMGFEAKVTSTAAADRVDVVAEVAADDEMLTGRKGEVRQALQHLLNRMVNRGEGSHYHLQLEINDFWKRREEELEALARQLAGEAVAEQKEVVTEYLNAQERRIIHVTLRDDQRVKTYALGDGMIKRLAVAPADFPEGGRAE